MNYFILIIVAVVSFFLGYLWGRRTVKTFTTMGAEELAELQSEAREALKERTEKRKQKILEFMKKEAVHHGELLACGIDTSKEEFSRQDVEKLLDVSEGTARKYLNELEAEGRVKQVGQTGPDVYYVLS